MPDSDSNDITRSHVQLAHGSIIGHYRIIERIGAGGMGEVYLAEDTELNRKVALKFLPPHLCQDPDCRARFKREAQAAAKLDHPNIVAVHEVGEFQGRPFFSMQHVEGQSLKEVIAEKALPLDRILEIGIQVCDGLQAAHEKGITHRDIKPSNILIDSHGRTRIVDFGLASVMGSDYLTKTGSTLGTIGYMSPEQVRGEHIDHRTDLFSFGVVLYEMITGHSPFKADSEAATLHAITNTKPELLARFRREVPTELQTVIDKALEKNVATRYQHADELSADLKRLSATPSSVPSLHKRRNRIVVPSLVILGLIVIALILKPWRFEVSPTHETQAATNWLAVMYFDNVIDPADSMRLGEIATNLLITGLSQSEYIRVMSSQRLYDLLKQMGKEGVKTIDRATASEIAKKADAKWMLTGSILQSEPVLVLTSQLIDVSSGGVIASQRITGNQGENIFAVIDRLTEDVKKSSALPAAMRSEPSVRAAEVTTHSQEAYRYYLEALQYQDKYMFGQARRSFLRAIELDSTFASAYLGLSIWSSNSTTESAAALAKAERYLDRVSDRERQLIRIYHSLSSDPDADRFISQCHEYLGRYPDDKWIWSQVGLAYAVTGNLDSSLRYFDRALALDPYYGNAHNLIGYAYFGQGQYTPAAKAIDKYIAVAPNEPNPYDTRAELYASVGELDSAIAMCRKALSIEPSFRGSIDKLGRFYLIAGKVHEAESLYQAAGATARLWLTSIPEFQGRFRRALRLADDCMTANRLDGMEWANAHFLRCKGTIYDYLGQRDSAVEYGRLCEKLIAELTPADTVAGYESHFIRWYYLAGDTVSPLRLLQRLSAMAGLRSSEQVSIYLQAMGEFALVKKDYAHAIEHYSRADSAFVRPAVLYRLAEAYLGAGDSSSAVSVLERLLRDYYELWNSSPYMGVTAHYLLGRAYESTGYLDKARASYEKFLTIWKDADPGLKDVEDAEARLTRLKAKS